MAGVGAVYIVTPGAEDRSDLVAAGVAAAKAAGVPHIVVVSVPSIEADDDLLFKGQFKRIEQSVSSSGMNFTILRLPMFFDNQWANAGSIKGEGSIYGPADPSKQCSLISVSDAGEASAAVLANPENHVNKIYTLNSDTVTFDTIAASFSKAIGSDVKYVQVPYPAASESMIGMGFPAWMVKGLLELMKLVDSNSPAAIGDTTDLEALLGHAPTSFETWAASVAGGFK